MENDKYNLDEKKMNRFTQLIIYFLFGLFIGLIGLVIVIIAMKVLE